MILRANERAGRTITVFALLVVLVFGVASLKAAPASVAAANSPEAVSTAFQMDATHDGDQPNETLTAPTKEWTHAFTGVVSYPLIVGGRIFVTVANPVDSNGDGVYGSSLWALSASNGSVLWGPIALGGTYDFSGATYDNGRVFAINEDGDLWAFDAASGHQYWEEQLPPQTQFSSLPTAYGGVVYVGGSGTSGTLYAVNETDGTILWRNDVLNGDNSSPAVTATGVYVTYAEDQDYDFSLGGTLVWHDTDDGFEGGGGRTPAYYDGNLYVRDTDDSVPGRMLDGGTGAHSRLRRRARVHRDARDSVGHPAVNGQRAVEPDRGRHAGFSPHRRRRHGVHRRNQRVSGRLQ
jgi:outer membrane protein assembly factor BamB